MAWGDNGITDLRFLQDQQGQVTWAGSQVGVQFNRLQNAGYLRKMRLYLPPTLFTTVIGGGTAALQPAVQLGVLRGINRFTLTTQAVNNIIDLRGEDLYFLRYIMSGEWKRNTFESGYNLSAAPTAPNGGNSAANSLTAQSIAANNPTLTYMLEIPLTEKITFRDSVVKQASDRMGVVLADREQEMGLISIQNSQFAIQPKVLLNPLFSTTVDAPLLVTGNTTSSGTANFRLETEIYDVPPNPADRPSIFQRSMIVVRQNAGDEAVSGGSFTHNFRPAGLLLGAIYVFYDVNDNFVDVSANPLGTVTFTWGTSVLKYQETVQSNLARCADYYNQEAPQGILVHNFLADDGTVTQPVNTAILTNVRTIFTGMPGSITTMRVIEIRLIPVKGA